MPVSVVLFHVCEFTIDVDAMNQADSTRAALTEVVASGYKSHFFCGEYGLDLRFLCGFFFHVHDVRRDCPQTFDTI